MNHGQASVERGFNDNNVVLKDNMNENKVIARRFIKNFLRVSKIEPSNIQIKNDLEISAMFKTKIQPLPRREKKVY